MDNLNERMQMMSLWNVLRASSSWVSKASDGVASERSSPRNNAAEYDAFDVVGMTRRAELAAGHVLDATKDVLADLREKIAKARSELEAVDSELSEKKDELAVNEKEVADAALRREIASADAEFLAWQRREFEPQVEGLQWDWKALQHKIKESVLECEAVKTELRAHDEKMESVKSDLASKRMELASLEMAIDEAARKKRTEREEIQMLVDEREKTERGIQKMGRNYRALSADLLDMELQILEKGDELAEMKPHREFHMKCLRGASTKHGVPREYACCKNVCSEKERTIKELEKVMAMAKASNLALLAEKRDLEDALKKRTLEAENASEEKLATCRAKITDCWKQVLELRSSTDAFFIFLRVFGRQMHETAVACLSEETDGKLRNMLEMMAAEVTSYKEAVHGRGGKLIMGTAFAEAYNGCKNQMDVLHRKLQCLVEME